MKQNEMNCNKEEKL